MVGQYDLPSNSKVENLKLKGFEGIDLKSDAFNLKCKQLYNRKTQRYRKVFVR